MKQTPGTSKDAADKLVRGIKRRTRKHYSAEEKIHIVLAGLRGEESISALCRREGIAEGLYYSWSKEFLEAGKQRLAGDTATGHDAGGEGAARRGGGAQGGCRRLHPGEPPAQKKHDRGWGGRRMRYPASEKLESEPLMRHWFEHNGEPLRHRARPRRAAPSPGSP